MSEIMKDCFERCCRLCAEEQEVTVMIFGDEAEDMLLQNKLNKYLLIEVEEDDKLPKNICIKCCTKLQTVCDFIDMAHKAQETLMNQSILLEEISIDNLTSTFTVTEIKAEPESDDDLKITEMEVSVDPMMVLQNSEEQLSPNLDIHEDLTSEDVTYLHSVDSENVTIKLIRKGEKQHHDDEKQDSDSEKQDNESEKHDNGSDKQDNGSEDRKELYMKPFPCKVCRRSFCTELALKNHSWIHYNDDKSVKQFNCSSCNEGFDFRNDLIKHLKEHRSNGLCTICGRVFRNEHNLAAHMNIHVSKKRIFTCKDCGRSYNTFSNLKTHSITHSNERPFNCHLCKKSFKRNQDLKFHINQHTGNKPYKCPFCEKSFASSGNCYSHRSRMHPGRRVESKRRNVSVARENKMQALAIPKSPLTIVKGIFKYKCHLCEHSFMKRDNFNYHMFQHTGEKPFQCTFCSEMFVTRRGILIHHDKEHPSKDRPLNLLSKNVVFK